MRISTFMMALLGMVCAFLTLPARAQGPGAIYSVQDVLVDETAVSAAAARPLAFSKAQEMAWSRVTRRLVSPTDFTRLGVPTLTPAIYERVVTSIDVQEERRSGTRYIARLNVNFNPILVRQLLAEAGYGTITDQRGPPVLVAPVLLGASPALDAQWRLAWSQSGFQNEIAPVLLTFAAGSGPASWEAAQAAAQEAGAASVLFVTAQPAGAVLNASLTEVGPNGLRADRGTASANVGPGESGFPQAFRQLALAVNAKVQDDWKARVARGAGPDSRVAVQALYANQTQWLALKRVMEAASRTLVSDIRIDAVSTTGALISLGYVGTLEQLRAEIARDGGVLLESGTGLQLRLAAAQ
jgi:hypothetical protein